MAYTCEGCGGEADTAHTITVYDENGVEDRLEILCQECYEDWLHAIKG